MYGPAEIKSHHRVVRVYHIPHNFVVSVSVTPFVVSFGYVSVSFFVISKIV
jgi:hypothetical protein